MRMWWSWDKAMKDRGMETEKKKGWLSTKNGDRGRTDRREISATQQKCIPYLELSHFTSQLYTRLAKFRNPFFSPFWPFSTPTLWFSHPTTTTHTTQVLSFNCISVYFVRWLCDHNGDGEHPRKRFIPLSNSARTLTSTVERGKHLFEVRPRGYVVCDGARGHWLTNQLTRHGQLLSDSLQCKKSQRSPGSMWQSHSLTDKHHLLNHRL